MPLSSNRGKSENTSNYSNTSTFGKVLINNQSNWINDINQNQGRSSFVQFSSNNNQNINWNGEDFTDEVDEYDNDSNNHRISMVKRFNINTNLYQPGSRIAQFSPIKINKHIESFNIDENVFPNIKEEVKTESYNQHQQSKLNQFVTKVPQTGIYPSSLNQKEIEEVKKEDIDINIKDIQINLSSNQAVSNIQKSDESLTSSSGMQSSDIHRLHFLQTIQALHFIKNGLTQPSEQEIEHLKLNLPPPNDPQKRKTIIFDMDETLIHCVDDIESEDPQFVIPIQFPDEDEPVNAGINVRPYIYECLEEANKHFQVIVFTASHKSYADAILDYIDPDHKYIQYRLYRENCVQTKEGYYVKDLRIFRNRDMRDLVIVDNSVYSFSFQIDNGIPIIPYYEDKEDEEMLHLIYYLNCIHQVDDVREQNKEAFELSKLQYQTTQEILAQYYTNNNKQMLLQNEEDDEQIMMEDNEDTQEIMSEHDEEEKLNEFEKNGSTGSLYLLANQDAKGNTTSRNKQKGQTEDLDSKSRTVMPSSLRQIDEE